MWGIIILIAVTRLILVGRFGGAGLYGDELLTTCVGPQTMAARWAAIPGPAVPFSNTTAYAWHLAIWHLVPFSPVTARVTTALWVTTACVCLCRAVPTAGWAVATLWLVSAPLVTHSVFATEIGLSLLPPAITMWLLTRPTPGWVLLLGPLIGAAVGVYPPAAITSAIVLVLHAVYWRAWTWGTRSLVPVVLVLAGTWAYLQRAALMGTQSWRMWGNGSVDPESFWAGMTAILRDLVWDSTHSFDAVNAGRPFLPMAMGLFVLCGLRSRRALFGLLVFSLTVVLVSPTGEYPGIRRAFAAYPFVILGAAEGLSMLCRTGWPERCIATVLLASLAIDAGLVIDAWPAPTTTAATQPCALALQGRAW